MEGILPENPSIDDYVSAQLMFVGTPDEVFAQLRDFYFETGGFGNLLMMGQAGLLDHADTVENLTMFAKDILPRLQELHGHARAQAAAG